MTLTQHSDAGTLVLDYSGEIFNCAELRTELNGRGHHFSTVSDTELVLHAYQEWGTGCAQRLRGMFAFAVWDTTLGELVLIRDRFGVYPLFYSETADGVAFGSEPKAIFASGACRPIVGLPGLRELMGFTPTPGLSVFEYVREVQPGEVVRYGRDGLTRYKYWSLTARQHEDNLTETLARVRWLLADAVDRQLVSDVPLAAILSGGLDSSAVASLACRQATAMTRPQTFSMEFEYHLANFRPDEMHDTPDSPYAHLMARRLATVHRELLVTNHDLANRDTQVAVVKAMDKPVTGLDMYIALYLLSAKVREFATVVLTGDGSDELFGGYVWFHDPWYVKSRNFPWLATSHHLEMLTGLLDRKLAAELDIPGYTRARYEEAIAEVPHIDGVPDLERRMREATYLNLTRYLRVILDRKDRMGMAEALEGRVPFCDHELVEYVFNVPWAMKTADGKEKSLLRAAVADLLPAEVISRRKSPFPTIQDPEYRIGLREQLREIIHSPSSRISGLLDTERVRNVLEDPSAGLRMGITRMSIETAIQMEWWMSECGVELKI